MFDGEPPCYVDSLEKYDSDFYTQSGDSYSCIRNPEPLDEISAFFVDVYNKCSWTRNNSESFNMDGGYYTSMLQAHDITGEWLVMMYDIASLIEIKPLTSNKK